MKTPVSRTMCAHAATLCGIMLMAAVLAGCQTANQVVSTDASKVCPMCKTVTRTTAVKGLNYTKHLCPGCRTVRDTGTWDESADLTEVRVCDHCKAAVMTCPQCAKN